MENNTSKLLNLGKISGQLEPPGFLEHQTESFNSFLDKGIEDLIFSINPIKEAGMILEFSKYYIEPSQISYEECRERRVTYQGKIKSQAKLKLPGGEIKEQEVILANIPLMSDSGTFLINGTQRVVVSQLTRSPGVYFEKIPEDQPGSLCITAYLIPDRGTWIDFEVERNGTIWVRIDKKSRRVPITVLLRAAGLSTDDDLFKVFNNSYKSEIGYEAIEAGDYLDLDKIKSDYKDELLKEGTLLTGRLVYLLKDLGLENIPIIRNEVSKALITTLKKDTTKNSDEAYLEIYKKLKPGEMPSLETAKRFVNLLLFDSKRNNLDKVGRYKINKRLGVAVPETNTTLTLEDIIAITRQLIKLYEGLEDYDDIDHLGNRRVKLVGELLLGHLKAALAKLDRIIRDKMIVTPHQEITPSRIVSSRPLSTAFKEFFTASQLSQYLDEINPLASLTHKRRLSSLGPGGLHRERAGIEVRDVHHSHYGRICPIETPEGANIGLINTLSTYSRINDYGFIVTPYFKVKSGKRTSEILYLTADEEKTLFVADPTTSIGDDDSIISNQLTARKGSELVSTTKERINLMNVSPRQIFSISASLIPFLEHDDANRALMGSNMYRQAVPLLYPEPPLVGTGLETKVAIDSGEALVAKNDGLVDYLDAGKIIISNDNSLKDTYILSKFQRTNQSTVFNQYPIVEKGQRIEKGQIIADSQSIYQGELSLGRNVLVAFMVWGGYNYEDAIIISEKLVRDDVFTSLHVEEYEIQARELKVATEEITRDIPGESEESLNNLEETGIIRLGAEVKAGDILVGKVTPRGEGELSPEDRILRAIFGEKASNVKNTSLRLPPGEQGVIVGVTVHSLENGDELPSGVIKSVKVRVAQKRKINVGDKIAGRHGNKGVIAKVLSEEDMPFLEDGTSVDIILNPLGVPSRMNVGQILEMYLGWIASKMGTRFVVPIFDGPKLPEITELLKEANIPGEGRVPLKDGKEGNYFLNEVSIGKMYVFKLIHLVEDKIHARAIGPYSLITQQPLGGKTQFGGQRFGEMEVWALEGHGAAYTLQEMLTIKSDDISGRNKTFRDIVKGKGVSAPGCPESFKVLIQELRSLCLDVILMANEEKKSALKTQLLPIQDKVAAGAIFRGDGDYE